MWLDKINNLDVHNASLRQELLTAMTRVMDSGWFVLGKEVQAFESEFAAYCGVSHCVSVANGTDALELAIRSVGVASGCEVITAANAGMYASTAILAAGGVPVFADVNETTMTLSASKTESLITKRTAAIIATHLYGQMADMPALLALAKRHGVPIIEDCAQAHGASMQGTKTGAFGLAASFSFYPTKNLGAMGDGGAVVTNDAKVAKHVRSLRQYGWQEKYRVADRGGRNSRLDEIQASILRTKLQRLDGWNAARREIAKAYCDGISNPAIRVPQVGESDYVGHLFVIRVSGGARDQLRESLAKNGIASEIHYPLLDYQQVALRNDYLNVTLPVSEQIASEILTLPCYPELRISDVRQVCEAINDWHA